MATTTPGDHAGKDEINQFNLQMRSQPWYQQWFAQRGLDPNNVKLSKGQREDLERTIIQNGAPPNAFDDMMIDPAGNLNKEHGFASLPTWAKVAIGAGAAAGGYFAAPAVASSLGYGGGTSGLAASTAAPAATEAGIFGSAAAQASAAAAASGAGGGGAAAGGGFLSTLAGGSKTALAMKGLGVASSLASGAANQRAQDRGAQTEYNLAQADRDANNTQTANAQALQYANAKTASERQRMKELMSADMLGSSKPPTDSRAILSGAGYMSPEMIAMMRERAMKALESGSDTPELQKVGPTPDMPQGTKTDSFLKTLSMAGLGLGAARESGLIGTRTQAAPIDDRSTVKLPQQQNPYFQWDDDQYLRGRA